MPHPCYFQWHGGRVFYPRRAYIALWERVGKRDFGTLRRLPSGRWQARYQALDGSLATAPTTYATVKGQ